MKGQKRCYSARSKVTITVAKQFVSGFSHPSTSQARRRRKKELLEGRAGRQQQHSASCWPGGSSWRPASGGQGVVPQQCTAAPVFAQNNARTLVPNSFSSSQLHSVRAGIFLGEKSNLGSLTLILGKVLKLTELFATSELSTLKYM